MLLRTFALRFHGMKVFTESFLKEGKAKKIVVVGLKETGKSTIVLKFLYDYPDLESSANEENYTTSIKFLNFLFP